MFAGLALLSFVLLLYLDDFVITIWLFKALGMSLVLLAVIAAIVLPLMFRSLRKGKVLIDYTGPMKR